MGLMHVHIPNTVVSSGICCVLASRMLTSALNRYQHNWRHQPVDAGIVVEFGYLKYFMLSQIGGGQSLALETSLDSCAKFNSGRPQPTQAQLDSFKLSPIEATVPDSFRRFRRTQYQDACQQPPIALSSCYHASASSDLDQPLLASQPPVDPGPIRPGPLE